MKYLLSSIILILIFAGCSSVKDVTQMNPEERFQYALSLYNDESYDLALKEFDAFLLQYPGNEFSDDAQFYIGQSRFQRKEYLLAAFEYSRLIKNMPASSFVPESQYMLASCYYELAPPSPLDQKYTRKAIEELQAFIDFFPADQRVPEAEKKIAALHERLAQKAYNDANIYEKLEYFNAAISYYAKVTESYHDTKFAPQALYRKIQLLVLKKRNNEALIECGQFLDKYPLNEYAKEIAAMKEKLRADAVVSK